MTSPLGPSYDDAVDLHIALEHQAAIAVTRDLRRQLRRAAKQITALYLRLAGSLANPMPEHLRQAFGDQVAAILATIQTNVTDRLRGAVEAAYQHGAMVAAGYVAQPMEAHELRGAIHGWFQTLVGTVDARAQAVLLSARVQAQLNPPTTYAQTMSHLAQAHHALTIAERDTRWSVNAARNLAIRESAERAGMGRLWIYERDACLHCLAYGGEIAPPGQPFPAGLTFYIGPEGQPKPLSNMPVWGPPLHPNCRCDTIPAAGTEDYPVIRWETEEVTESMALKREAKRSVLKGMSGSDSTPARLRAADALLARGAGLPKSVEAKARAAVRAGRFR